MTPQRRLVTTIRDAFDEHEADMGGAAEIECVLHALNEQALYYEKIGCYTRADWFWKAVDALAVLNTDPLQVRS